MRLERSSGALTPCTRSMCQCVRITVLMVFAASGSAAAMALSMSWVRGTSLVVSIIMDSPLLTSSAVLFRPQEPSGWV